jgi:hypothetical protein
VPVCGHLVGDLAGGRFRPAEEGLGRGHVPVLTQYGVHEVTIAIDGAIQVASPTSDLQVGFIDMPVAAAGTALAVPPLSEFAGQDGRELYFPIPNGFVAEDDPTLEEHLAEVAQGQAVAQSPQHHQRDHVARVLGPVQQAGAALVELLAAITAAEPALALDGAVQPLGDSGRAAADAFHPQDPASRQ